MIASGGRPARAARRAPSAPPALAFKAPVHSHNRLRRHYRLTPEGQRHVDPAEVFDLLRGALRMRLRLTARPPRTVRVVVRLMLFGAVLEFGAAAILLGTAGSVRACVLRSNPQVWTATQMLIFGKAVISVLMAAWWVWAAWASRGGREAGRRRFGGLFTVL